jgi:MFS family permease
MMRYAPVWSVLWMFELCLLLGAVAFIFLPETALPAKVAVPHDDDGSGERLAGGLSSYARQVLARLHESLAVVKSPSLVVLLLTILGTAPMTASCLQFLIQYTSKRFGLAIQDTGYLLTAYGAAQIVQGLVVLPVLSRLALVPGAPPRSWRRAPDEQHRDLLLARWSYGVLVLGFALLGAAATLLSFVAGLLVLATGSAATAIVRSLLSLYVDSQHRTRLFSLVAIIESVGAAVAPTVLATLFTLGMRLSGAWVGLPYWGVSALCLFTFVALFCIRLPKDHQPAGAPGSHTDAAEIADVEAHQE